MSRTARLLALGTTMCLALLFTMADARARNFYVDAAIEKDINELTKLLEQDKVDQAKVDAVVAKIKKANDDLNDLMAVYKPTKSKGLGWNPGKKGPGDGIETRIIALGTKKELTKAELEKEKAHIIRAAHLNLAMYEIAKAYAPAKPKAGKGAAEWNKHNKEVKEGSMEAIAAVKANDPAALKKAMAKIGSGCNECHTDFRN